MYFITYKKSTNIVLQIKFLMNSTGVYNITVLYIIFIKNFTYIYGAFFTRYIFFVTNNLVKIIQFFRHCTSCAILNSFRKKVYRKENEIFEAIHYLEATCCNFLVSIHNVYVILFLFTKRRIRRNNQKLFIITRTNINLKFFYELS